MRIPSFFVKPLLNRRGGAWLEALVVAPSIVAFVTLLLSTLILAGGASLLEHRLDEALVCLTYRPRFECENEIHRFIRRTGLSRLGARTHFIRQGSRWHGRVTLENPWGRPILLAGSIHRRLTKNIR